MKKIERPVAEWQTPAQRKYSAEQDARHDAQTHRLCELFGFWRVCEEKPCRRAQSCEGDMHACFARHWAQVPEANKEMFRAYIKARAPGVSHEAAVQAAKAEVARIRALEAQLSVAGKGRLAAVFEFDPDEPAAGRGP